MAQYTIPTSLPTGMVRTIITFFLVLILLFSAIKLVDAGTVGVVKQFGRVTGRVLDPGIHLVIPLAESVVTLPTKKVTYETSPEDKRLESQATYKDYPVDTNTQDGQPVDISYTIRFSVDPTQAGWIVQNIGTEIDLVEKIVKAESRVWARNIPRNYKAETIYTGEGSIQIQNDIFESLEESFNNNGLILDLVGIREIKFDEAYVAAIKTKQEEEVKIETESNKAQQELFRKEQRITAAEASAREQELQRATLSDQVIQKLWLDKWNGILPTTLVSDSTNTLLQLPR
jgi:regulator of protease activity HflC (stomatin/prohibitin superfamily)